MHRPVVCVFWTGNPGEWLSVVLGSSACRVFAVQINFADEGAKITGVLSRSYEYIIEASNTTTDISTMYSNSSVSSKHSSIVSGRGANAAGGAAVTWKTIVERGSGASDAPHDWVELPAAITARTLRITSHFTPGNGKFSLSGFRVFGTIGFCL